MLRCRHAFEYACVHANGDVVCSIIDGRGEFVLGNVHQQPLSEIFVGERAARLRELMLSREDAYCPAIGRRCPLKTIPRQRDEEPPVQLRYLAIEPTTACDLRCLCCPVRDFSGDVTWRDAYHDGGMRFMLWDGVRRTKQHAADGLKRVLPMLAGKETSELSRLGSLILRGRIPASRRGALPIDVVKRVVDDAGPNLQRVDFFNYGEPFLYKHLVEALRHVRRHRPGVVLHISTDGMQVTEAIERIIVEEQLLDWLVFSIDGCDEETYKRYRIGGRFETTFANLVRFHRRAAGTALRVVWQYVVFEWNDSDEYLRRAVGMAEEHGIELQFDFAHTWGRSRRRPDGLAHVVSHLKPFTSLPGQPRHDGW